MILSDCLVQLSLPTRALSNDSFNPTHLSTGQTRLSAIEEQKTLHEEDGPVTSILMSREAEVGPMFKFL